MSEMAPNPLNATPSLERFEKQAKWSWWLSYLPYMGLCLLIGFNMLGLDVNWSTLAWVIFIAGIVALSLEPRLGIYMIVLFTLMGDAELTWWWPFDTNFSSRQSLLYWNDSMIFSPLELYLTLTLLSWLFRVIFRRDSWRIHTGPVFWAICAFSLFLVIGFVYGTMTGGDSKIGLWEVRPIFYLVIISILISNLFHTREQITSLMWVIVFAIFLEGLSGVLYFGTTAKWSYAYVSGNDTIIDHIAAIHHNAIFVFATCLWLFRADLYKRVGILFTIPPIFLTYIIGQRRAAYIALALALALITVILYRENRRLFWLIAPTGAVFGLLYIAAFWNSGGALGKPVQAIKSVIAPNVANSEDVGSNIYRILENANIAYTIRSNPLLGVGFGNKFKIIVPMPDISFFEWWEYFTHNSIVWVWMKTGFGGFFSLLYLIGTAIMAGVRLVWRMPSSELSAVSITAVMSIIMHFLFAYVDMSWGPQGMIFLGVMFGIVSRLEYIAEQPLAPQKKRYPWQGDPDPGAIIRPLELDDPWKIKWW